MPKDEILDELAMITYGLGYPARITFRDFTRQSVTTRGVTCWRGNHYEVDIADNLPDLEVVRVWLHEAGHILAGTPHEELESDLDALDFAESRSRSLLDIAKVIDTQASEEERRRFDELLAYRRMIETRADEAGKRLLKSLYKHRLDFPTIEKYLVELHDQRQ